MTIQELLAEAIARSNYSNDVYTSVEAFTEFCHMLDAKDPAWVETHLEPFRQPAFVPLGIRDLEARVEGSPLSMDVIHIVRKP